MKRSPATKLGIASLPTVVRDDISYSLSGVAWRHGRLAMTGFMSSHSEWRPAPWIDSQGGKSAQQDGHCRSR
jgi:hypothetical protein